MGLGSQLEELLNNPCGIVGCGDDPEIYHLDERTSYVVSEGKAFVVISGETVDCEQNYARCMELVQKAGDGKEPKPDPEAEPEPEPEPEPDPEPPRGGFFRRLLGGGKGGKKGGEKSEAQSGTASFPGAVRFSAEDESRIRAIFAEATRNRQ